LDEETELSVYERLSALEATCDEQKAQIDGLVGVVSDLLAAHVVLHKDLRLCSFLREYIDGNISGERQGGTTRIPAQYFRARGELFAKVLEVTANSMVFEQYWSSDAHWSKQESERASLDAMRQAIARKIL